MKGYINLKTWVFALVIGLGFIVGAMADVLIHYKPSKFELFNDGHSISIKPTDTSNYVEYNNEKFILRDIRINFKMNTPIEVDFIHYNPHRPEGKDLLVIRVPIKISADAEPNNTLNMIISKLSPRINDKKVIALNPRKLLPESLEYNLVPSLSIITPLPDEAIGLVLNQPMEITPQQKEALANKFREKFANTPPF